MLTDIVQRWNGGRGVYRPAGEPIVTRHFEVAPIADDTTARGYVTSNHYSRSYPAARRRFGLYRGERLVGVSVYSVPTNELALAMLPGDAADRVELGRFVLDDSVPANGESWFLARTFEFLRAEGFAGVLSFSDPEPRQDDAGVLVFPGHVGTIYQATNAVYLGRATPRTLHLLPDGSVLSARAIQKVRARERGWRYVAELMEKHGADPLSADDDARQWVREQMPRVTRSLRHRGNHRYAWTLHRRDRRHLPDSLAYPKFGGAA